MKEEVKKDERVAQATTTTVVEEDNSKLISMVDLSRDCEEAGYDDSLQEVIVLPSLSFP